MDAVQRPHTVQPLEWNAKYAGAGDDESSPRAIIVLVIARAVLRAAWRRTFREVRFRTV
jgi:hypothetical protein